MGRVHIYIGRVIRLLGDEMDENRISCIIQQDAALNSFTFLTNTFLSAFIPHT